MTRDEAQQKLSTMPRAGYQTHHILDVLETLGLITFDQVKQPYQRAEEVLFTSAGRHGMLTPRMALDALREAKLKIVDGDA